MHLLASSAKTLRESYRPFCESRSQLVSWDGCCRYHQRHRWCRLRLAVACSLRLSYFHPCLEYALWVAYKFTEGDFDSQWLDSPISNYRLAIRSLFYEGSDFLPYFAKIISAPNSNFSPSDASTSHSTASTSVCYHSKVRPLSIALGSSWTAWHRRFGNSRPEATKAWFVATSCYNDSGWGRLAPCFFAKDTVESSEDSRAFLAWSLVLNAEAIVQRIGWMKGFVVLAADSDLIGDGS